MRYFKYIVILILTASIFSAQINQNDALKVAKNTFNKFNKDISRTFQITDIEIVESNQGAPLMYIFNLLPRGFIIVSAENNTLPVLAYGFKNDFKNENMPPSLAGIFNGYKEDIQSARESSELRRSDVVTLWNEFLSANISEDETRNVDPLLLAEFDQGGQWNNLIPTEIGWNIPVGCVAVAMGQVMHYWKHPYVGEGYNSYTDNGVFLEADFSSSYYDFDNMPATYASDASRLLLFHAGISVNMDYDQSGSGAWVMGSYPSSEYSMEYFFKYSSAIHHLYKTSNNETTFMNAIKSDLDDSMPVIMVGYGSGYGGGHAWNVDGYQGNNLHCNWGWGGWSNGYFNLTTMGGFPDDQSVLLNIIPRDIENPIALYEYEVDASTVYFSDLSAEVNEYELRNYYWDFDDGNTLTSTSGQIDHTFAMSGAYNVELIVENIYGMMSEPFSEVITVYAAEPGDLNQDNHVDVLDVILMVNFILGDVPTESELFIGDLNSDGIINIQDIIMLVNIVIN